MDAAFKEFVRKDCILPIKDVKPAVPLVTKQDYENSLKKKAESKPLYSGNRNPPTWASTTILQTDHVGHYVAGATALSASPERPQQLPTFSSNAQTRGWLPKDPIFVGKTVSINDPIMGRTKQIQLPGSSTLPAPETAPSQTACSPSKFDPTDYRRRKGVAEFVDQMSPYAPRRTAEHEAALRADQRAFHKKRFDL